MSTQSQKHPRIRVVIADDNKEIRDKVIQLLQPEFEVVGSARDGGSACEAVMLLKPDIVVLDISMPIMSGIDAAKKLKKKGSKTKPIFLTVHDDPDFIQAALRVGAVGYVVKSQMATDLLTAMRSATEGDLFISPSCTIT
jgi:DNA-binding NarL/FixJ family response regulator